MQEKLDKFLEQLQNKNNILAVILFGSYARGNNRPDSDIDLVVIIKEGYKRAVEYLEGQAFEIFYVTEKGATDYWENNKSDGVSLWENAQVLFDRDGTGQRLKEYGERLKIEKRAAMSDEEIAHSRFDVEDTLHAIEEMARRDSSAASFLLHKKIGILMETYFDLHQEWIPAPKQRRSKARAWVFS